PSAPTTHPVRRVYQPTAPLSGNDAAHDRPGWGPWPSGPPARRPAMEPRNQGGRGGRASIPTTPPPLRVGTVRRPIHGRTNMVVPCCDSVVAPGRRARQENRAGRLRGNRPTVRYLTSAP